MVEIDDQIHRANWRGSEEALTVSCDILSHFMHLVSHGIEPDESSAVHVWTALSNSFAHVLPDIINGEGVDELLIPAANHKKLNKMFWLLFMATKEKLHNVDGRCEGMLAIFTWIIS